MMGNERRHKIVPIIFNKLSVNCRTEKHKTNLNSVLANGIQLHLAQYWMNNIDTTKRVLWYNDIPIKANH